MLQNMDSRACLPIRPACPHEPELLRHEVYVSSLGELQIIAEHFRYELDL